MTIRDLNLIKLKIEKNISKDREWFHSPSYDPKSDNEFLESSIYKFLKDKMFKIKEANMPN